MTYEETLQFMYSQLPAYHRIGRAAYKSDLGNSIRFDEYLNHPHEKYRTIHVGGTNGKGSVSHMIASVLMEAGYKTGLYTSPHLKDFRERIRINGRMISGKAVTDFIRKHAEFIRKLEPSFFEMTVALAFEYFAENRVDIAVIEVGLGGRLDSTNIIRPVLSVITNIGHDHMDLLGDTPELIAAEKAGIIKQKTPVVISENQEGIRNLFAEKARIAGSPVYFADQNFVCHLEEDQLLKGSRAFCVRERQSGNMFRGTSPLGGDYQSKNIQAAFQAFKTPEVIFEISSKNIIDGIRKVTINTKLMGRWQILGRKPLVICDTGHNREGLEYVVSQIKRLPVKNLRIVLGFVSDKDLRIVLPLFPDDAIYYFTKASVPRAMDEKALMNTALSYGLKGTCHPDVKSALSTARRDASAADLIFVGGSTFVVAEVV